MLNFCTLYNSNYAAKGLAMYWSLKRVCPEFMLYVFAFDDILAEALKKMALPNMTVITLAEFEDEELLRVKPTRSVAEYCWTCTASTILYCLKHFSIDHCTYLDSDLFFYLNPQAMINEMEDDDVLITPHWFAPDKDNSAQVGKYCVQFVTVRNTPNGIKIIQDWRTDCIDWCYSYYEDGKMGDQMYLDAWPEKYQGICVSSNMGGGVAPWNMDRYNFRINNGILYARDKGDEFPVIFAHFHFIFTYRKGIFYRSSFDTYPIRYQCAKMVFRPYLRILSHAYKTMRSVNSTINGLAIKEEKISFREYLLRYFEYLRRKNYKQYYWV